MLLDFILKKCHLSETKEQIARNLFWAVFGKIVTLLGSLFVGIIIARYLGPKQYGLMNYVISYVSLFQILAIFGLDSIEIREEAKHKVPFQTIIGTAFTIKLIMAIITMILTIATSCFLNADLETTILISVYTLSIIANTLTVCRNYFMAIVQNEYIVKSEIARTFIGAGIKVVLLLNHADLMWFIAATTFDYFLLASGYSYSYRKKIGSIRDWKFDSKYALFLIKESFPLLLTSAAVIIYQRIDQVMIGQMIGTEPVGYFSVASRIVEILIYIPAIAVQTIAPILVRAREHSITDYIDKAQRFMNATLWATIIVAIITSVSSYWIIYILFGDSYLAAVPILQILSFKAASVALSSVAGHMIIIEGIQYWAIFRDIFGCIVCVGLNYMLLPRYGIIASAFIAILSNIAAGYLADAIIPAYRHLFIRQTKALFIGWLDLFKLKNLIVR